MAYSAWAVSAGETPTAAKWNILGSNDASFRDGTGIQDGAILLRHLGAGIWDTGDYKFTARSVAAPTGWLLCNGQEVSKTTYADLYGVIGDSFALGTETVGNFRLPSQDDKSLIGKSGTRLINTAGGNATVNLAHGHTVDAHAHGISNSGAHSHYCQHTHYMQHQHYMNHQHGGQTSHNAPRVSDGNSNFLHSSTSNTPPSHYHDFTTNYTRDYTDWTRDFTNAMEERSYTDADGNHNHGGGTGNASPGTSSSLSSAQSVMNPYIAANLLIKA